MKKPIRKTWVPTTMVEKDSTSLVHECQMQIRLTLSQRFVMRQVAQRQGKKPSTYARHAILTTLEADAKRLGISVLS